MGLSDPSVQGFDPSGPFFGDGNGDGGFHIAAAISASLGSIAATAKRDHDKRQHLLQSIRWTPMNPLQGVPVAGALTLTNAEVWGPKTGYWWAVQRVTVAGLANPSGGTTTTSTATGTITAGAGSAALASGVSATGFTLSFSAAPSTAGTATLSNVVGGPYVYNIPSGQTSPYTVVFPAPIAASGAPTLTVAGLGTGAGTIILYGSSTTAAVAGDQFFLYKGSAGPQGVVPQNQINQQPITNLLQFNPGRTDLILQPGDFLIAAGTSLTSTSITVSADMIVGTLDTLPDFLI